VTLTGSVASTLILKANKLYMKKKILLFSLFIVVALAIFFTNDSFIFSQGLEVEYPSIDNYRPVSGGSEGLPDYLKYIIRFLTISAGVVVFGSLIYGGFLWMTSEGEPLKVQKSKTQILSSFIGFLIIISSFVLLNSINPTLVELKKIEIIEVEDINSPGVYLSLSGSFHENNFEEMQKNVRKITAPEGGLGNLKGKIKAIRIVNPVNEDNQLTYRYVVVLHGEENFRGPCEFILTNNSEHTFANISDDILRNIFSITVFRAERYGQSPYGRVVVYNKPDFEDKFGSERLLTTANDSFTPLAADTQPWSIEIEGDYTIILASGSGWNQMSDECAVFASSRPIPNLTNHYMNTCKPYLISHFFSVYESCATHYALFPLFRR
jgi:hypothetical protein